MPKLARVGLLTGTFDPIHRGHVAMARAAMAAGELDEVWVLVNPDPDHKQGVTDYRRRAEMVQAALVGENFIRLGDPGGLKLAHHDWSQFQLLMAKYPQTEFYFIVGADVLEGWERWRDAPAMAAGARFLVARRAGTAQKPLNSRLQAHWFDSDDWAEVSSGRIRQALAQGDAPVGLDGAVLGYIAENGLYGVKN